jgi:hypothetical protein
MAETYAVTQWALSAVPRRSDHVSVPVTSSSAGLAREERVAELRCQRNTTKEAIPLDALGY